jgi:addiction module HigA family antidote
MHKAVATMRARKRPPTHPGRILREDYLEPLSLSVTKLADYLDVSRKTVSKIVNERGTVTPDMALRLSKAFKTTPTLWLNLQKEYDLWHAEHESVSWRKARTVDISDAEVGTSLR